MEPLRASPVGAPGESPSPGAIDGALQTYIPYELSVLHHAIIVADAKASFVLTVSLGLAVFCLPDLFSIARSAGSPAAKILVLATELVFLASGTAAFFTVLPRVDRSSAGSDIAWMSEGFMGPINVFVERSKQQLTLDKLQTDQLNHLYVLAKICREKYKGLRLALWLIPLGLGCFVISRLLPSGIFH